MLLNLIYVSSAVLDFTPRDLAGLLQRSRCKNAVLGVTGMLLHQGGNFIQVLEGEEEPVRSLFDTIAVDPRHKDVRKIFEERVGVRSFGEWSMGFENVDMLGPDDRAAVERLLVAASDPAWDGSEGSFAMRMLVTFKRFVR